jgi:hypothetical protein
MNSKEYKSVFGNIAKAHGFERAYGVWFKESPECIIVLELQKSNHGDYYKLNIKIYVQGMFGNKYKINKELIKKDIGDILSGEPVSYRKVLDFDEPMEDLKRQAKTEELFNAYIVPKTDKAITVKGIKELFLAKELFLTPAVKAELGID